MINIYRASAGAGKTHKLTGEYIKLLFKKLCYKNLPAIENISRIDATAYKHILAVTFTNKATDEMKSRILKELHKIANGSASDYLQELQNYTGRNENQIREYANKLLVAILHDYSLFSVSTIDKFFQSVMRSFARELGKMSTYNIEINDQSIIQSAVDRMYDSLDKSENKDLLKWLVDYSLENIEDGRGWNIKPQIMLLSRDLFSENFKLKKSESTAGSISPAEHREQVFGLKNKLSYIVKDYNTLLKQYANEALDAINSIGRDVTEYKGGSKSPFCQLKKLANGSADCPTNSLYELYDRKELWVTKNNESKIYDFYTDEINNCLGKINKLFDEQYKTYATASIIKRNINSLGILGDIHSRIIDYCKEKNVLLLSDTVEMLNKIIDGKDTPFIYEKIGIRFDNFLLDEFQDTSKMQWENFRPLLHESLANGEDNLIVGDVKQSIYRWRSSDWNILNSEIQNEFGNQSRIFGLEKNWRSARKIIEFNNIFFDKAADILQKVFEDIAQYASDKKNHEISSNKSKSLIKEIYSGFQQEIPTKTKRNGYVEINVIDRDRGDDDADLKNASFGILLSSIKDAVLRGYSKRDMAVLVRTGKEGVDIAKILTQNGYRVVSNESLYIGGSPAVQKIVNVLRTIDNPQCDTLNIYQIITGAVINREIISADIDLLSMPLYHMCEMIVRKYLLKEEKEEVAYIQAFLDEVIKYVNEEGENLPAFLKWWDENCMKKTISAPDTDAISILTIHKAKGLGFKIVFLPYFNFSITNLGTPQKSILWCTANDSEIGYKAPIPMEFSNKLQLTDFASDFYIEALYSCIDALNIMYVAFTRAIDELYIVAPSPIFKTDGSHKIASVSDLIYDSLEIISDSKQLGFNIEEKIIYSKKDHIYSLGEKTMNIIEKESTDNAIEVNPEEIYADLVDSNRTKTSMRSGSINEEDSVRNKGIALHYLFSLINHKSDIKYAVKQAVNEGIIAAPIYENNNIITDEDLISVLTDEINGLLNNVESYGWFAENTEVVNEREIISPNGSVCRPDRVIISGGKTIVIDYKFGVYEEGSTSIAKYKKQIKNYAYLLDKMGFTDIHGYIWYVLDNIVIS